MYYVEAKGRDLTRRAVRRLNAAGFVFENYSNGRGGKWVLSTDDEREAARAKHLALRLRAKVNAYSDAEKRSSTYRRDFLKTHKPEPDGRWKCAYCGRKVPAKDMEVDHVIPVRLAQTSSRTRKLMRRWGYSDINDPKNLVSACRRCNRAKGKKTGWWMYTGHYSGTDFGTFLRVLPKAAAGACVLLMIGLAIVLL